MLRGALGSSRRLPARVRPAAGLLAVGVAVVFAGLVVRVGDRGEDAEQPRTETQRAPLSEGPVAVHVPPGWSVSRRVPSLPGIALPDPVVLADRRSKVDVVVETLPATSTTLLPAGFVAGLRQDLPMPTTVRMGRRLQGFHYAGLVHPRVGRLLDLYVAPTTMGNVTVACLAEAVQSLLDGCWSVVSRLAVARGRPLPADGTAAFREVLAARVAALDAAEARARRALKAGTTPAGQARAFAPLGEAYRDAAAAAAPVAPPSPDWPRMILESLKRTGAGYDDLRRSLADADRAAYSAALARLITDRGRLRRLLDRSRTTATVAPQP
jgi:hypothetical protein